MLTANPDFPIDPLAGVADPMPIALQEALRSLRAPLNSAAAPYLLGTVLPLFIATGRPLSTLAYYAPDCLSLNQIARALQDHPAAQAQVTFALERAHSLLGVSIARFKGDGRADDAATTAALRKIMAEDLSALQSAALVQKSPMLGPPRPQRNWLASAVATLRGS